jgi:calcineurin-like phosphoesterase family protein
VWLYDEEHQAIGLVHAGWRGTLAGIAPKAVKLMQETYGSDPAKMKAAIGPGISMCCFETGPEVIEAFSEVWDFADYYAETAEEHFGDDEILKQDLRPFKNAKQFARILIKTWNKQASRADTIYVIADFVDCNKNSDDQTWKKTIKYVKKVRPSVILIIGNNEQRVIERYFENDFQKFREYCLMVGFKEVYKNTIVHFIDRDFYLTHKPIDSNMAMLNLFGHMHRSGGLYKPYGINIGCDLNHFRLYSEDDIKFLIGMKEKYWDKDKNLNMESIV